MRRIVVPLFLLLLAVAVLGVQAESVYLPLIGKGQMGAPDAATPTATPTCTPTATPEPTPTATIGVDLGPILGMVLPEGRCEIVEIMNISPYPQPMTGWRLQSVVGDQWYTFLTGFVMQPGAVVAITSGPSSYNDPPNTFKWTSSYIWNNAGDEVKLYDPQGKLVDSMSYSE